MHASPLPHVLYAAKERTQPTKPYTSTTFACVKSTPASSQPELDRERRPSLLKSLPEPFTVGDGNSVRDGAPTARRATRARPPRSDSCSSSRRTLASDSRDSLELEYTQTNKTHMTTHYMHERWRPSQHRVLAACVTLCVSRIDCECVCCHVDQPPCSSNCLHFYWKEKTSSGAHCHLYSSSPPSPCSCHVRVQQQAIVTSVVTYPTNIPSNITCIQVDFSKCTSTTMPTIFTPLTPHLNRLPSSTIC